MHCSSMPELILNVKKIVILLIMYISLVNQCGTFRLKLGAELYKA